MERPGNVLRPSLPVSTRPWIKSCPRCDPLKAHWRETLWFYRLWIHDTSYPLLSLPQSMWTSFKPWAILTPIGPVLIKAPSFQDHDCHNLHQPSPQSTLQERALHWPRAGSEPRWTEKLNPFREGLTSQATKLDFLRFGFMEGHK